MNILGISAYYHDSSSCLLTDGRIAAAVQEERFSRKKHDAAFPVQSIAWCRSQAVGDDLAAIVYYEKPFRRFERLLETYLTFAPRGAGQFLSAMPGWLKEKLWVKERLARESGSRAALLFCEHHAAHAAAAFFPSPFPDAAFLTLDGVGEWATASFGVGEQNRIQVHGELRFPHSLGLLYSAFTYYCGFQVNSGEYKLMGLAPYGSPVYADLIREKLIDIKADGSFHLNLDYFDYCTGATMTNRRFDRLFGRPPRKPESPLTQLDLDLARSIQEVTEEIILKIATHVAVKTGKKKLCLGGGVALNCVANGRLLREGPFDDLWIQPAAGDAGGAVGAALYAWHHHFDQERLIGAGCDAMQGGLLGPAYDEATIRSALVAEGVHFAAMDEATILTRTAQELARGQVVGWFQGKMEFGPRALGNRSILADPRLPGMQQQVNLKVKYREGFRPFAPAVLEERAAEWFVLDRPSPYMLLVAPVHPDHSLPLGEKDQLRRGLDQLGVARSTIPAVTHVDGSARVQTVNQETHPLFHRLLSRFEAISGCPVLVNTSFNVRGEPIVCSPQDAIRCFLATDIDGLAIGRFYLDKSAQPKELLQRYPRGAKGND